MADYSIAGLIQALKQHFGGTSGAEEISKALPAAVMPREAVLKQRSKLADLDRMLKESGQ